MKNAKRIVMVDDHELIHLGIRLALKSNLNYYILLESQDSMLAWDFIQEKAEEIDIVILDMSMPNLSGIDLCRKIKDQYQEIIVIIFSMNESSHAIFDSISAKANGFIKKGSTTDVFLFDLDTIVEKGTNFSSELLREYRKREKEESHKAKLTPGEEQILNLIMKENTSEEIAKILSLSKKTVDAHRANMMQKFDTKTTLGLIKKALSHKFKSSSVQ